jgi:hypothetical protein
MIEKKPPETPKATRSPELRLRLRLRLTRRFIILLYVPPLSALGWKDFAVLCLCISV